jgi:hypothetical protein
MSDRANRIATLFAVHRPVIEDMIETLIAVLDALDGDAEAEDGGDEYEDSEALERYVDERGRCVLDHWQVRSEDDEDEEGAALGQVFASRPGADLLRLVAIDAFHAALDVPLADPFEGVAARSSGDQHAIVEGILDRAARVGDHLVVGKRVGLGEAGEISRRRVAACRRDGRSAAA